MRKFKTAAVLCTLVVVAGSATGASAAPVKYTVTLLGDSTGEVIPNGINNAGQVVGIDRPEAFLYSNGVMTGLGMLPGHEESWAYAINNSGVAVGYSALDDDYGFRAVKWENDVITDLGDLGGGTSGGARGINDVGQIVGGAAVDAQVGHAFLWENGSMSDLGTLGGEDSFAYGINEAGHVVGWSDDSAGFHKPFMWQGTEMAELTLPVGYATGQAVAINDVDDVVGWVWPTGVLGTQGVLWSDGQAILLPSLGGAYTYAQDMNGFGEIVGSSRTVDNDLRATLWSDGAIYDLNDFLEPGFEGVLNIANSINDSGQIVAYGNIDADSQYEAFLLTPVPEPSTGIVSLLLGIVLLCRPKHA